MAAASERMVVLATYRALLRCARTVESTLPASSYLRRNAADVVIRSKNMNRVPNEMYAASMACAESGPMRAVRAAFEEADEASALDRALDALSSASEVARFAAAMDVRISFFGSSDRCDCELARIEAAAFRLAYLQGASRVEINAARRKLDEAAGPLLEDPPHSTRDLVLRLRRALPAASGEPSHRFDLVASGEAPGVPIVACVAAMGVARRAGFGKKQIVGIGAQGRFLLALRGVGAAARCESGLVDEWYVADHKLDLVRIQIETAGEAVVIGSDGIVSRILLGEDRNDLRIGSSCPALLKSTDGWIPADCLAVGTDEIAVISRSFALHLRRLRPADPSSVIFLDCFAGFHLLTRAQLLDRPFKSKEDEYQPPARSAFAPSSSSRHHYDDHENDDELAPPFPKATPIDVARRMSRNLHYVARRRNDVLHAMLYSHVELDIVV